MEWELEEEEEAWKWRKRKVVVSRFKNVDLYEEKNVGRILERKEGRRN